MIGQKKNKTERNVEDNIPSKKKKLDHHLNEEKKNGRYYKVQPVKPACIKKMT